jgi:hypothetical protein
MEMLSWWFTFYISYNAKLFYSYIQEEAQIMVLLYTTEMTSRLIELVMLFSTSLYGVSDELLASDINEFIEVMIMV